jgi:group I intron endonuclease
MKIIGKIPDKASGIYCIMNILNSKRYIGRATKFGQRKRCHRSELDRGVSKEIHLQNSYNKYGGDNFIFFIVEHCILKNLKDREQYWMDFYECRNPDKGYNIRLADEYAPLTEIHKYRIGLGNTGKIRSKEANELNRIAHLGRKHSKETKKLMSVSQIKRLPILLMYSKDGKLLKKFSCQREAFKYLCKAETGQLSEAIKGVQSNGKKRYTAHGYIWKYEDLTSESKACV